MNISDFLKERGYSQEFSLAAAEEAEEISFEIDNSELEKRKLLFDKMIITIDGDDSKDLDDAVSIELLDNGNYYLGVHIADVSYYVKEKSALDKEAFERGTSVYLVDNVVPMLPKRLSNGICSLNPDEVRLTLSCFMEIESKGGIINYEICKSAIISRYRMTYNNVTRILEGNMASRTRYAELVPHLELMRELAMILRDKRTRRGSIDFDIPEPYIVTDENGRGVDVKVRSITVSNRVIEEFMLAANETVAKHMSELNMPSVYRVHENPDKDKIQSLATLVNNMGYKLKISNKISPKSLQNLLFKIEGKPEYSTLSTLILRSMMKARYSEKNLGHFGLAAEYYCHFTSPIRRYPDLMVHRILSLWLDGKLTEARIRRYAKITAKAAEQASITEEDAAIAERDYVDYKICEIMEDKVGIEFDGVISSITSFGFFVQLDNLAEGLVRMVDLDDDYYDFIEEALLLSGRRTGKVFSMGQRVKIRVAKVNTELKQIDFVLAESIKEMTKNGVKKKNGGKGKGKRQPKFKKKARRSK